MTAVTDDHARGSATGRIAPVKVADVAVIVAHAELDA
jgi:hypothetical protein